MNARILQRLVPGMVFGLAICLLPGALDLRGGEKTEGKVELKVVKHADLMKAIADHKGKVVLVDFWATFCPPCIEKFPKIVELEKKHAGKGLVCISVTFDSTKKMEKALDFLKAQKATFTNFLVTDTGECQEQWDFVALPTYLVFGKDGKLAKKFTVDPDAKTQFTIDDVKAAVEKQLE